MLKPFSCRPCKEDAGTPHRPVAIADPLILIDQDHRARIRDDLGTGLADCAWTVVGRPA